MYDWVIVAGLLILLAIIIFSSREYIKMTDNTNKQLKGNQLSFDASIKNFKADGSDVVITLVADSKKINLNTLNEIAQNKLTVDFTSVQTELLPKKIEEK